MFDSRNRGASSPASSRCPSALFSLLSLLCVLSYSPPHAAAATPRPNIIVIMADDLGAEGLGRYGSTLYSTPNLDRMADEGARFANAYATPLCTPTRVMLMTGQYPNHTGFTNLISKNRSARMPSTLKTFATYFKAAGYKTAIAGKWQLGRFDTFSNQPVEHGFDEYCLWKWKYDNQKSSRYYHPGIWRDGNSFDGTIREFGPDIYLNFILNFMEAHRRDPFLVYFPMALVHKPFVRPPDLKDLAHSKYPPGTNKATAMFGHMVTYMDMMVGRIIEKTKSLGIDKNTLIIFTGDNGSPNEVLSRIDNMVIPGGKGHKTEAGTRVPFIARWPGKIPAGVRTGFISLVDVLPTIAALAGIPLDKDVDGWDLSHDLLGTPGRHRDHVFFAFKNDFWIRDKDYRYHDNGDLIYCPVTSDRLRYGTKAPPKDRYKADWARLREMLENYKRTVPQTDAGISVRGKRRRAAHRHRPR